MHPTSEHAPATNAASATPPRQIGNQLRMIKRRTASPNVSKGRKKDKKRQSERTALQVEIEQQLVLRFDSPAVRHFAFIYAQAETAIRIRAYPSFEHYRRALLSIVGQGNQRAIVTLLALRPLHHPRLLAADPNRIVRAEIIRPSNLKQRAAWTPPEQSSSARESGILKRSGDST